MDASEPDLFELRLGVFATGAATAGLAGDARTLLAGHVPALAGWSVRMEDGGAPAAPGDALTVAELYAELPEQWRVENPGRPPGGRAVHELRIGVLADPALRRGLQDRIAALACPDPEHTGPCPVPWSSGFTDPGDATRADLERRYGRLRYGAH
ncbi:hypothetical protein ACFOVU_28940 [Nocardiopsis sediminis]|uniref:Uncharacterized protein n=1 Tax=Nocardiopsis sediminis TaxID=1778267 RepID=A0ABV8FXY9_9ACTN